MASLRTHADDLKNVGESYCRPCLEKGHHCMTMNIVDGRHVCIFCEDGLLCPVLKRPNEQRASAPTSMPAKAAAAAPPAAAAVKPAPANSLGPVRTLGLNKSTESESTIIMKTERQTCRHESGCENKINANNKLGLCKEHKGSAKAAAAKPAKPARATRSARKAPAPKNTPPPSRRAIDGAAGVATICVTEEQLDRLFLALPLERKANLISQHLATE